MCVRLGVKKDSSLKEQSGTSMGCPGGSGVTVPGGVRTMGMWALGTVDSVILGVFFNLSDSVISNSSSWYAYLRDCCVSVWDLPRWSVAFRFVVRGQRIQCV